MAPPMALTSMDRRYAEQQRRWEERKKRIRETRAQSILKCMDAFMRVVQVRALHMLPALGLLDTLALGFI